MDFIDKLDNFNDNYVQIKHIIKKSIGKKLIKTGSGGSSNIIVIHDNFVIKIIPNLINPLLKKQKNNDYLEAEFYKKFTNEFIKLNKTPHIVGIYKRYLIEDIKFIFPTKCLTLDEKILLPWDKQDPIVDQLCYLKKSYNKKLVGKKASVLVLENCPTNISNQAEKILGSSKKVPEKLILFKQFINRVIFQFMFTLSLIQITYPNFIHNDMFLRNILAVDEYMYEPNDYVQYNFNSKSYYLPANGIYIKLNDFGFSVNLLEKNSTIVDEIKSTTNNLFEINNPVRDIYTFLFDLYNGPGVGGLSLSTIIKQQITNKKAQNIFIQNLKKEIGKYFKYKLIDKIQSKNLTILDWQWDISNSKMLMGTIKKPIEYFKSKLFDSYTVLPVDARIVKIFN